MKSCQSRPKQTPFFAITPEKHTPVPSNTGPRSKAEVEREQTVIGGEQIAEIIGSGGFADACERAAQYVRRSGCEAGFSVFVSLERPTKVRISEITEGEADRVNLAQNSLDAEGQIYYEEGEVPIQVLNLHYHPEGREYFVVGPSIATGRSEGGDLRVDTADRYFKSYDLKSRVMYSTSPIEIVGRVSEGGRMEFIAIYKDVARGRFADKLASVKPQSYSRTSEEELIGDLGRAGFKAFFFSFDSDGKIADEYKDKFRGAELRVVRRQLSGEKEIEGARAHVDACDPSISEVGDSDEEHSIFDSEQGLSKEERRHLAALFDDCYLITEERRDDDFERLCEDVRRASEVSRGVFSANSFKFPGDIRLFLDICDHAGHEVFAFTQEEIESRIDKERGRFREEFSSDVSGVREAMSAYEPQFSGKNIVISLSYHPTGTGRQGQERRSFAVDFIVAKKEEISQIEEISREFNGYLSEAGIPLLDPDDKVDIIDRRELGLFRDYMDWIKSPNLYRKELARHFEGLIDTVIADSLIFTRSELIKLPDAKPEDATKIEKEVLSLREGAIEFARENPFFRALLAVSCRRIGETLPGVFQSGSRQKKSST